MPPGENQIMLITGTRKGVGRYLVEYYTAKGLQVIGCSREPVDYAVKNYRHFCLDVADESKVREMVGVVRKTYGSLDVLINNAGIASMNHILLTPLKTVESLFATNFHGTFLFCREAAKLMQKQRYGRIVNLATIAVALKLEGEAIYAASKAAVITLTQILSKEVGDVGITVNALGPTPIRTDLIRNVPEEKITGILERQTVRRLGEYKDVSNVVDFFIDPASDFVTGQSIFLGGVC